MNAIFTKRNIGIISGILIAVTTLFVNLTSIIDFIEKHENQNTISLQTKNNSKIIFLNEQPIDANSLPDGESGFTYVNKTLGFMISRPNLDWLFGKELSDYKWSQIIDAYGDPHFLGGVLLELDYKESLLVSVYDQSDVRANPQKYVQTLVQNIKQYKDTLNVDYNWSLENDWAKLRWSVAGDLDNYYYETFWAKHNGKIYQINMNYDGKSTDKAKKELEQIYDSFKFVE